MKTRIKVYKGERTVYTPQKLDKVWKWSKFKFVDEWVAFKEATGGGMGMCFIQI